MSYIADDRVQQPQAYSTLFASSGVKWCANSVRVFSFISVTARRSVDLDDDKVVSEYEEDRPEGE